MAGKFQKKLTESDVLQMKQLFVDGGMTIKAICEQFKVSKTTVLSIKAGRQWGHVKLNNHLISKMMIYKLTNKLNGKSFISSTILPHEIRMMYHELDMQKFEMKSKKLYQAMNEDGYDSFTFERLDTANNIKELTLKEGFHILQHNSIAEGYNSHMPIQIFSQKTLKRMIDRELKKQADEQAALNYKPRAYSEKIAKGSNHHNSKFTEDDIREIKIMLRDKTMTQTAIAEKFNVTSRTITLIKQGKTWTHVEI